MLDVHDMAKAEAAPPAKAEYKAIWKEEMEEVRLNLAKERKETRVREEEGLADEEDELHDAAKNPRAAELFAALAEKAPEEPVGATAPKTLLEKAGGTSELLVEIGQDLKYAPGVGARDDEEPAEKGMELSEEQETIAAEVVAKSIAENSGKLLVAAATPAPDAVGAAAAPAAAPVNLNDKMPLKAQEQGFTGKHVKHADGKTAAADWQNEYATKKGASFLASPAGPAPAAAKDAKKTDTKENLNDKMPLKAASQGFTGKKVEHEDGKTATSDWHKEYPTKKSSLLASAAGPAPAAAGSPAAPAAPVNLNDKMPLKAAEQGFTGKQVKHADGKTAATDWQKEYKTAAAH